MLARGIRSYHRPTRIEEAQDLAAQGASLLGGGTRVLASEAVVPNVVDLIGLGLSGVRVEDEDLLIGAVTPVLDLAGAPAAHTISAGLLPLACRLALPSRILRGMATVGGEAIAADPDSELVAALLVLNAVFLVAHPDEPRESPALRFLSGADKDLRGGGVLRAVLIPGAPDGASLERVAALPSLPPIVAVAATTTMSGDKLARVRLAVTGLAGPPARVIDAEAKLERTAGEPDVLEAAAEIVASHAPFRDDAVASASVRRRMARALTLRALRAALERGKQRVPIAPPRVRANPTLRLPAPMPNFTSGRLELAVNGRPLRAEA
ncbi:MAG TPA: FAD binding domain-containing protein, partial [Vicinamibacteria bacterium]